VLSQPNFSFIQGFDKELMDTHKLISQKLSENVFHQPKFCFVQAIDDAGSWQSVRLTAMNLN